MGKLLIGCGEGSYKEPFLDATIPSFLLLRGPLWDPELKGGLDDPAVEFIGKGTGVVGGIGLVPLIHFESLEAVEVVVFLHPLQEVQGLVVVLVHPGGYVIWGYISHFKVSPVPPPSLALGIFSTTNVSRISSLYSSR